MLMAGACSNGPRPIDDPIGNVPLNRHMSLDPLIAAGRTLCDR
jgi:hypothetical protein